MATKTAATSGSTASSRPASCPERADQSPVSTGGRAAAICQRLPLTNDTGGLVANIPGWSDKWFKALASLAIGAWMPGVLESSVKAGAGFPFGHAGPPPQV